VTKIYDSETDPLADMIRPPQQASAFGPDAWVYSEMAARSMVIRAYELGSEYAIRQISVEKELDREKR